MEKVWIYSTVTGWHATEGKIGGKAYSLLTYEVRPNVWAVTVACGGSVVRCKEFVGSLQESKDFAMMELLDSVCTY